MPSAGVHPIALLSVCELCTRANLNESTEPVIGGLYGTRINDYSEIWYAFEVKRDSGGMDTAFLIEKDGLLKTTNPSMQLLGWFTVGDSSQFQPWVFKVHAQVQSVVADPLLCVFAVPFPRESTEFPVAGFKLNDAGVTMIPVELVLDRPEETAVNDVMTSRSRSKGAISDQLAKQTNAMTLLQQRLTSLRDYMQRSLDGESVDMGLLAKIVTAVDLLVREQGELHVAESKRAEVDVVTEALAAVILSTDTNLISKTIF